MMKIALIGADNKEDFWLLADNTKMTEKYRIDKNLQYLQFAPIEVLRRIFIQYRFFTHYYISDLVILISKLPFGELKTILAEILYEELGNGDKHDAHPILYDNFLLSIGVQAESLEKADALCLDNLKNVQTALINKSWAYGIGLRGMGGECLCQIYLSTMHEFFSKNEAIIAMQDKISWKFWDIHIGEADLHHQEIVRAAIDHLITEQPDTVIDITNGYLESKNAWDNFWKRIFNMAKKTSNISNEVYHDYS